MRVLKVAAGLLQRRLLQLKCTCCVAVLLLPRCLQQEGRLALQKSISVYVKSSVVLAGINIPHSTLFRCELTDLLCRWC
jgi:hypothetical protein